MIYEDEIFLKRKMLNEILLQTEKNEDLFKMQKKVIKEQMQEFQTYQQRININTDHNINKFINLYLSNSQFQWSWISYNTLIAQEKIKIFHKFPWIKFLYNLCFDFNITFNQFVKLSEETNSFASFLNDKKMILNLSLVNAF